MKITVRSSDPVFRRKRSDRVYSMAKAHHYYHHHVRSMVYLCQTKVSGKGIHQLLSLNMSSHQILALLIRISLSERSWHRNIISPFWYQAAALVSLFFFLLFFRWFLSKHIFLPTCMYKSSVLATNKIFLANVFRPLLCCKLLANTLVFIKSCWFLKTLFVFTEPLKKIDRLADLKQME